MKVTFDLISIVKSLHEVERSFKNGGAKHAELRDVFRSRKLFPCAHVRMVEYEDQKRMLLKELVSGSIFEMLFEPRQLPVNS